MIIQYEHLHRHPTVFRAMIGLSLDEFDHLLDRLPPHLSNMSSSAMRAPNASALSALDVTSCLMDVTNC